MRRTLYQALLCCLILPLQACGQRTDHAYGLILKGMYKNTVPQVKASELSRMLQQRQKPVLLDIRSAEENEVSFIQGATFVDYDAFTVDSVAHLPKGAPLVLYCAVGYRSERVGEMLLKAGYPDVRNLHGGIFEWVNKGNPIYDRSGKTEKVHAFSKAWGLWLQKGEKVYGR